jgi:REase_DpnII-MboI
MKDEVVKHALGSLDKLLSQARQAVWEIEREVFGDPGYGEPGGYANPRGALRAFLEELHDLIVIVLEAAEMPQTRTSLIGSWPSLVEKGLGTTVDYDEFDSCESRALTFLERIVNGLRISAQGTISSEEAWTLTKLETMLRDTAALVHRRPPAPANEIQLQGIMHDYLRAAFSDFRFNPAIGGSLKHFKPDCGIASVSAAVEFKFVRAKAEVAGIFSGVAEDTAGYKGSKDWTRFYAVIYQAEPFMAEGELRSDLKRIGAATWTPFVVNGPTAPKKPKKKSAIMSPSTPS